MIRLLVGFVFSAILIAGSFQNILKFGRLSRDLPPLEADELVVRDSQFRPIRDWLVQMNYRNGKIGFVTPNPLKSKPRTLEDEKRYYLAQYNLVPAVIVPWMTEAPLTLGCFFGEEAPNEIPGLTPILDAGNGLILYSRRAQR